jgi:hypothetical protein
VLQKGELAFEFSSSLTVPFPLADTSELAIQWFLESEEKCEVMGCSYFPHHEKKWLCVESLADRNIGAWNHQHWDAAPVALTPYSA